MYPSSLRSTVWGKHSEGFIPFSPSLQVLLVPIYCQSSIAAQKKLQHRWPQVHSLCGHCKGRELKEMELKTVQNSTSSYFYILQFQLVPVQAANVSHLTDQTEYLNSPNSIASEKDVYLSEQTQSVVQGLASPRPRSKSSKSENTTCSMRCYFVTSKLHY